MLIEFLLDLANNSNHKTYFPYFPLSWLKLQSLYNDCKKRGKGMAWDKDDVLYLLYLVDKWELILTYKINGYFVYDTSNIIYKKQYLLQNLEADIELIKPIKHYYFTNNVSLAKTNDVIDFTNKLILAWTKKYILDGYTSNKFILSFKDVVLCYVEDSKEANLRTTTEIINTLKKKKEEGNKVKQKLLFKQEPLFIR